MSRFFHPHREILPPAQQRLWPLLQPAAESGFVLYGGTAIALRIGHRQSVDFDFFSERPLDRVALLKAFPFLGQATVLQEAPNSLGVLVADVLEQGYVKISFFGTIGIGRVGEPEFTADGVLQVASLEDLMATKVKVVLQRVEAKDYRDIAALLAAGVGLSRGLAAAGKMYGSAFQPSESLKALVYFEGGDLNTLTTEEKNQLVKAVSEVRDLPRDVEIVSRQLAVPMPEDRFPAGSEGTKCSTN